jgi:signal transduction histidine kinase/CheY-like chemotaxis protein
MSLRSGKSRVLGRKWNRTVTSIRFKVLALMAAFGVLGWIGVAGYWFPRTEAILITNETQHLEEETEILAGALLPFVLQNQFAGIYETLDALILREEYWETAILTLENGTQVYPLIPVNLPDNPNLVSTVVPVAYRGTTYATLEVVVDISHNVTPLLAEQKRIGYALLSLFLVAAMVLLIGLDILVGRRIALLQLASKQLARGDFSATLPKRSRDEIGWLSRSFDAMREQIFDKERSLIEARRAAEAATVAKSQFLATMSHEIRTPLNGVMPVADLLMETTLDDRQRDLVSTIQTSGQALKSVIDDILDWSKLEVGKLELRPRDFALGELMTGVQNMLSVRAEEGGLVLRCAVADGGTGWYRGDADRLRQVLINLVGNAIKFTEKGSVTMDARATCKSGRCRIEVRVTDTGIGIPEDRQSEVFNRFEQVDSSRARKVEGTGLGLSISKAIIDLMDGEIGVNSQIGKGSTFWFTVELPVAEAPAEKAAAKAHSASQSLAGRSGLRVLVVDDNQINLHITSEMIRLAGHVPATVDSGKAVIEAVQHSDYDVVLMDVQMPDIDGLAATRAIRNLDHPHARVPIIGYSASAFESDQQRCLQAGMDGFLAKPLSKDKLAAALQGIS